MQAPNAPHIAATMSKAMHVLLDQLARIESPWAVTGSLGQALQGVELQVNDIDIQTDGDGAYAIDAALAPYAVTPVRWSESDRIRSHFGNFFIEGTEVEVMGALQKRLVDGDCEQDIDLPRHIVKATFEGRSVPVLALEYEAQAYELLGRAERASQLRRFIDGNLSSDG